MYSPEFRSKALKVLDECDGSCAKAAKRFGVVYPEPLDAGGMKRPRSLESATPI